VHTPFPSLTPSLIRQLDQPGPRYTSYPTAPEWLDSFSESDYHTALQRFDSRTQSLSIYTHIPFCTQMCYYCGCNVTIRKRKSNVADEYLEYLAREFDQVSSHWCDRPTVTQIHWGGGTPNFLTIDEMTRLKTMFDTRCRISPDAEVSIEVDPRSVDRDQIVALRALGFNRISMGIQDFAPEVQSAIHRVQSVSEVTALFAWIRHAGFKSINVDLIYGLPNQNIANFTDTVTEIIRLKPDRVALYSYAHVPWLKSHQQLIDVSALPDQELKLSIFIHARQLFLDAGYEAVGMDHFALPDDELAIAFRSGALYRNFMGYTINPADDAIGLGVSSIGYIGGCFSQNVKDLKTYYSRLDSGQLPVDRGIELSRDDHIRRWVIQSIMCQFSLIYCNFSDTFGVDFFEYFPDVDLHLQRCESNGLVVRGDDGIRVTPLGRFFVRNVAMGFDAYLKSQESRRFSQTI